MMTNTHLQDEHLNDYTHRIIHELQRRCFGNARFIKVDPFLAGPQAPGHSIMPRQLHVNHLRHANVTLSNYSSHLIEIHLLIPKSVHCRILHATHHPSVGHVGNRTIHHWPPLPQPP